MTSHLDELLERARLVHQPYGQADIDAAEARLAARTRGITAPSELARHRTPPGPVGNEDAQDLTNLCETVVAHPEALVSLRRFLAHALPQPVGARVLGCLLQLSDQEESARFWWQYAAGAGDHAATYCLYLHHRALGEDVEANWWHTQTYAVTTQTVDPDAVDVATSLRVLRALKSSERGFPDAVHAVLGYVPVAVAYVDDDLDLPLPEPDFADRVRALSSQPTGRSVPRDRSASPLPERKRRATADLRVPHPTAGAC